jgi:uncharacterized Zn finger protein (UPF0148 family)
MVVVRDTAYCSKRCRKREQYENRRDWTDGWRWTHDCAECGRPMFTPPHTDGWWCPECDREEPIDRSGFEYVEEATLGGHRQLEHDCPECESWLSTHDGTLRCLSCEDVHISLYSGEWWALLEQEYGPRAARSGVTTRD